MNFPTSEATANTELQLSLEDLLSALPTPANDKNWILALMEENIIQPIPAIAIKGKMLQDSYVFSSVTLTTVRRASRLQRDFDASPKAIGLILSLLDELHGLRQLRRQVAMYHDIYEVE